MTTSNPSQITEQCLPMEQYEFLECKCMLREVVSLGPCLYTGMRVGAGAQYDSTLLFELTVVLSNMFTVTIMICGMYSAYAPNGASTIAWYSSFISGEWKHYDQV